MTFNIVYKSNTRDCEIHYFNWHIITKLKLVKSH